MPLDTGCLPDTLLTIGRSDNRTFLFMAICYTHSHTTKKQKLKGTIGSILLLEGDLFLFAVSFILVWMCLGSSKTVVSGGCMWTCTICTIPWVSPSLPVTVSPSLPVSFSKLQNDQNASNTSHPKHTRIKGFPDLESFPCWACTHARL